MKTAITIYSDPGNEDALGRCFSGMAAAYDGLRQGDEVTLIFGGAGVRWPAVLSQPEHPAHGLYNAVSQCVDGVCGSCAEVFGAVDDARQVGVRTVGGVTVPGGMGQGLPSFRRLIAEGYTVLSF